MSKRKSHDSSYFYSSKLYKNIKRPNKVIYHENTGQIPKNILDTIILGDSQDVGCIPDCSVHLMLTSLSYNVSKKYDNDLTLTEYLTLLQNVFKQRWSVLVPGGRAAFNINNVGRKLYIPLHAYIIEIMLEIGFHMRGKIIWDKGASAGVSCGKGSFASASNLCLRDVHEYILIFSKLTNRLEKKINGGKKDSIHNEDFVEWSKSIWKISSESVKRIGHPAPFSEALPRRLIEFYSYIGDIILDPFMRSGTTAIAAIKTNRHYIGYEISNMYINLAKERVMELKNQLKIAGLL